jgi:hypothetical protein
LWGHCGHDEHWFPCSGLPPFYCGAAREGGHCHTRQALPIRVRIGSVSRSGDRFPYKLLKEDQTEIRCPYTYSSVAYSFSVNECICLPTHISSCHKKNSSDYCIRIVNPFVLSKTTHHMLKEISCSSAHIKSGNNLRSKDYCNFHNSPLPQACLFFLFTPAAQIRDPLVALIQSI